MTKLKIKRLRKRLPIPYAAEYFTHYSLSETKSNLFSRSPKESALIKLFPSGSNWPKILLAMSAGVSDLVNLFSKENKTENKWEKQNTRVVE